MFIRTITIFYNTDLHAPDESADKLRSFVSKLDIDKLRGTFKGIEVLNIRLSVSPPRTKEELWNIVKVFEQSEFDYYGGIGTIGVSELSKDVLEATKSLDNLTTFISVHDLYEASEAAKLLLEHMTDDTSSARFIIGVNPPRFSPYLPYSFIKDPAIAYGASIAINRIADLYEALDSPSYEDVKQAVFSTLPKVAYPVHEMAINMPITYLGIDISLAPMPGRDEESVGRILTKLSDSIEGMMGYIHTLNEALKEYPIVAPLVGYNRVMTPLGEDPVLVRLASEGKINLDTLKAWTAVCSTGVDVVPVRKEKTIGTVVDTIAIGLSAKKTLGVRLIPMSSGGMVDLGPIGKAPVLRCTLSFSH